MLGLLEKDFRLIMQRKQSLFIFLCVTIILGFSMDGSFVVGYMSILGLTLAIGTIGYDEFDNGYPFIMTLPITTKIYVIEKYIFSLISGIVSWSVGMLTFIIIGLIKNNTAGRTDLIVGIIFIAIMIIMMDIMIPIELKFGAEKSRIAILFIMGVVGGFVILVAKKGIEIAGEQIQSIIETVRKMSEFQIGMAVTLIVVLITAISIGLSTGIMKKTDF